MVVSRPVKDSCSLTPAGALLVSSSDPGIKLHFPPDCTVQTRTITLQVALQYMGVYIGFCYWSICGLQGFCCPPFRRCFRCPRQRYRFCVMILRPALALSSASPRFPAQIFCSLSKFRSLCHLESQVQYAMSTPSFRCMFVLGLRICRTSHLIQRVTLKQRIKHFFFLYMIYFFSHCMTTYYI